MGNLLAIYIKQMKIPINEFKVFLRTYLQEAISFKEDQDRLRRSEDGYGETDFEEGLAGTGPAMPSSQRQFKDKSSMQQVGPAPTLDPNQPGRNPFTNLNEPPKKAEGVNQSRRKARGYQNEDPADYPVSEVGNSTLEPTQILSPEEQAYDSGKVAGIPSLTTPKPFNVTPKSQKAVYKLGVNAEKDLKNMAAASPEFKFTKQPNGDFEFSRKDQLKKENAPSNEKAEDFIKKNKADFKKRYGARWEEVLYSAANKKFK